MTIRNNWQEKIKKLENFDPLIESLLAHCQKQKNNNIAIPIIEDIPQNWYENEFIKQKINLITYHYQKYIFKKNALIIYYSDIRKNNRTYIIFVGGFPILH